MILELQEEDSAMRSSNLLNEDKAAAKCCHGREWVVPSQGKGDWTVQDAIVEKKNPRAKGGTDGGMLAWEESQGSHGRRVKGQS